MTGKILDFIGENFNTSRQRRIVNNAFIILSILAGCDTLMIDPVMNPPEEYEFFRLASDALLGKDELGMRFITYVRSL